MKSQSMRGHTESLLAGQTCAKHFVLRKLAAVPKVGAGALDKTAAQITGVAYAHVARGFAAASSCCTGGTSTEEEDPEPLYSCCC